jgi:hypothetical protein
MMITMWIDGKDYEVSEREVLPWLLGVNGTIDTIDMVIGVDGNAKTITIDKDPSNIDIPGTVYLVEFGGRRVRIAEVWVLPWIRGLAIYHGVPEQIYDQAIARRAQRVQALMVGHQRGWFTYAGFTTHKKEATT